MERRLPLTKRRPRLGPEGGSSAEAERPPPPPRAAPISRKNGPASCSGGTATIDSSADARTRCECQVPAARGTRLAPPKTGRAP